MQLSPTFAARELAAAHSDVAFEMEPNGIEQEAHSLAKAIKKVLASICPESTVSTTPGEIQRARVQIEALLPDSKGSPASSSGGQGLNDAGRGNVISPAPHHTMESLFWLLWFVLARANPLGGSVVPPDCQHSYQDFLALMLNHQVGHYDDTRDALLKSFNRCRTSVHPLLYAQGTMLDVMRFYLTNQSGVWGRLTGSSLHAHVVIKSLRLAEIMHLIQSIRGPNPAQLRQSATGVPRRDRHDPNTGFTCGSLRVSQTGPDGYLRSQWV
jgi:hypothetical protein